MGTIALMDRENNRLSAIGLASGAQRSDRVAGTKYSTPFGELK